MPEIIHSLITCLLQKFNPSLAVLNKRMIGNLRGEAFLPSHPDFQPSAYE